MRFINYLRSTFKRNNIVARRKWIGLCVLVVGAIIWESPLVPHYLPYCDDQNPKKEQCPAYDVTLVAVWKVGKAFDDHNGAVIAIFTIVLAIYTVRLALATDKMVTGAEDTAKNQLRAYIKVETTHEGGKIQVGHDPVIYFQVINCGQTPAHRMVIWSRAEVYDNPLQVGLDWRRPTVRPHGITVHPRSDHLIYAVRERPLTQDEDSFLRLGTKIFHVWGEVIYFDVFRQEQATKFHLLFGGPDAYAISKLRWAEDGNEAT